MPRFSSSAPPDAAAATARPRDATKLRRVTRSFTAIPSDRFQSVRARSGSPLGPSYPLLRATRRWPSDAGAFRPFGIVCEEPPRYAPRPYARALPAYPAAWLASSSSRTSRRASAPCGPWTACRSGSGRASSSPCSARAAAARPRCCACWPASSRPTPAASCLDGEDITDLPPNRRKVNTIFQSYALFPHLTVRENIAFGLRVAGGRGREIDEEVERMLALIQMEDQARQAARPDQRRPEAARGHRPRPHQQARGAAARRAAGRARPQAAPAHADRAGPDPRRGRHHLPLRHPRPGRGDEPLRPHRGDERRPDRADRHAGRDLRGARAPASSPPSSATRNFFEGKVAEVVAERLQPARDRRLPRDVLLQRQADRPGPAASSSACARRRSASRASGRSRTAATTSCPARSRTSSTSAPTPSTGCASQEYRLAVYQQHNRFLLDEKPIRWKRGRVDLSWHADDGFMLERYSESDEQLMELRRAAWARAPWARRPRDQARPAGREWLVTLPSLVWLLVLFLVPTLIVFAIAFKPADPYGGIGAGWTLRPCAASATRTTRPSSGAPLWLSVAHHRALPRCWRPPPATAWRARRADGGSALLLLVIVPFWTSFLIRIFAWKVLLHPEGALKRRAGRRSASSPSRRLAALQRRARCCW